MEKLMTLLLSFVLLTGCGGPEAQSPGKAPYLSISQAEALEMMQQPELNALIVDVRRADEYAERHIPGAVLVPNESITDTMPEALPDLNQTLLLYCRTGRRSKEAAEKLGKMGYTRVFEFGGIVDWTGETVSGSEEEVEAEEITEGLQPGKLLIDCFERTVGTPEEQPYTEIVLYEYSAGQLLLETYTGGGTPGEKCTQYLVPPEAYENALQVIRKTGMKEWNENPNLYGITGYYFVCKFLDGEEFIRVTSEHMPEDGKEAYSRAAGALWQYASEACRQQPGKP